MSDSYKAFLAYHLTLLFATQPILEQSYPGRSPKVKEQITEMTLNGSGVRDVSRVLKVSPTTVIKELKKKFKAESGQSEAFEDTQAGKC